MGKIHSQLYLLYALNGEEAARKHYAKEVTMRGGKVLYRNPKYFTAEEGPELAIGEGEGAVPIAGVFVLDTSPNIGLIKEAYEEHGRDVVVFAAPDGPPEVRDIAAELSEKAPPPKAEPAPEAKPADDVQSFSEAFGKPEAPAKKKAPSRKKAAAKPAE